MMTNILLFAGLGLVALAGITLLGMAIVFRKVVPTNMVHIVQSSKKTTSYGTNRDNGNVYYRFPSWMPRVGVDVIELPVSNFDINLKEYIAYDIGRVPFVVDVTAFFRIENTNMAAQRVTNYRELQDQLTTIVQGATRKVLASDKLDSIMLERSKFGDAFTKEVENELVGWGVESVKNMELMDIRDARDSQVIENIMAKEKSKIDRESRVTVAENERAAKVAEIEAIQATDIRAQEAEQAVGQRKAEKDREVGIANEQSSQAVKEQKRETAVRDMAIRQVEEVKQAEIDREKAIVAANEQKDTTVLIADGNLEAERRAAEGIKIKGEADAEAKKLMELAPIRAQIELAQEIGDNEGYQQYLILLDAISAHRDVGVAQAEALEAADIKVISNAGDVSDGVKGAAGVLSSRGGTNMAAMVEGFAQSPLGEEILSKLTGGIKLKTEKATPARRAAASETTQTTPEGSTPEDGGDNES